jgi:ABC-type spermidine/putrescine transport system permease subunit I
VKVRWWLLMLPPLLFSAGLLAVTQFLFIRVSFFKDLRFGRLDGVLQLTNYVTFFTDPYYLQSLWLTVKISALVAVIALVMAYPVAYVLARMRPQWASTLLALAVISAFITIVIKVLGLIIIFSADGPFNTALKNLGLISRSMTIYGSFEGVVVGLLFYTLSFMILILFSVIQTIPRTLEDAAEIHGASRWRVMWRVVLPLSLPGVVAGALIVFNLAMGAFTSAALLGGGRVLTLPVLIQQAVLVQTKYGMAGTMAAVLLVIVMSINVLSVLLVSKLRATKFEVL